MEANGNKKITWGSEIVAEGESNYAQIACETEATKDIDNADKYVFEVRRYKIADTREEYLNVKVFDGKRADDKVVKASDDVCAEIEKASIIELEGKLLNLRMYGILLGRKHYPKVRQVIEKAYPDLNKRSVNTSTVVTEDVVKAIYEMFVRYIKDVEIQESNGLYNIPVDEFKEYLADTEYSKYKYSDIRTKLAELKMEKDGKPVKATKCSYGRHDNTVAKGDKRIKVISFIKEVVDSYQIT